MRNFIIFKHINKSSVAFCLSLISLIFLLMVIFGCSNRSSNNFEKSKFNVVATIFPIYDFTRSVASDEVNLHMLMQPGIDSHSFEPTPKDISIIENCDLLIYVGGSNDVWLEKILNSLNKTKRNKIKTLNLSQSLGFDEKSAKFDYHIWTSIENVIYITKIIENRLIELDSKHSEVYLKNSNSFIDKLNTLKNDFKKVVSDGRRNVLVMADKFPFKYFSEEFNLQFKTPFANCSSKAEVSASEISSLVKYVKENKIPVILKLEEGLHDGLAETVANESGAKIATFNSCHTISKDDFLANKTYLSFMLSNLEILKEALN